MTVYTFVPINQDHLNVMDGWSFGEYFPDFDVVAYHASARSGAARLTGPAGCDGFAVFDVNGGLTGLFEYYFSDDGTASIGLALAPELTNQGLGGAFLEAGIEFLIDAYDYSGTHVHLDVDPRNEPAVKLYMRAGFEEVPTDAGTGDLRMRRPIT